MNFDKGEDPILESALRRVLRREEPGAEFVSRVRTRIRQNRRQRIQRYWTAVAALLAVSVAADLGVRGYQDWSRQSALRARQELSVAFRITTAKLHATHRMIHRSVNAG